MAGFLFEGRFDLDEAERFRFREFDAKKESGMLRTVEDRDRQKKFWARSEYQVFLTAATSTVFKVRHSSFQDSKYSIV
jgi:hypothetical protein